MKFYKVNKSSNFWVFAKIWRCSKKIQINLNGGKKRKYLYFQADYELKEFKINKEGDEPAGMGDGGNAGGQI